MFAPHTFSTAQCHSSLPRHKCPAPHFTAHQPTPICVLHTMWWPPCILWAFSDPVNALLMTLNILKTCTSLWNDAQTSLATSSVPMKVLGTENCLWSEQTTEWHGQCRGLISAPGIHWKHWALLTYICKYRKEWKPSQATWKELLKRTKV